MSKSTDQASLVITPVPVTTTFSFPSTCFDRITATTRGQLNHQDPDNNGAAISGYILADDSACKINAIAAKTQPIAFSPGLYCPSYYTTVKQSTVTIGTVTQTRAVCCPQASLLVGSQPNYFGQPVSFTFASYVSLAEYWTQTVYGCTAYYGKTAAVLLVNATRTYTTTLTASGPILNAESIQLVWEQTDLTTATTSPIPGPIDNGNGLTAGQKAAIGVVVPLAVLAFLVAVFFFMRRGRRREQVTGNSQVYQAVSTNGAGILVEKKPDIHRE